ncbi:four helix bundle protein [Flagellimonas sp.]|uniref:four helix bundle protein n=1 Tax=Flagellimonas sp. TaxID=2058762 RepID=UPI003B5CD47B
MWQKSQDLAVEVYAIFSKTNDFGFRDQITRASVSISNNIAEGYERQSNADFKRFLYFALASNSEVRSMLYLSERLNYTDKNKSKYYLKRPMRFQKCCMPLLNQ